MTCEDPIINLGNIIQKKAIIEQDFILQNASSHPIRILDTISTCSAIIDTNDPINPGEYLKISTKTDWTEYLGNKTADFLLKTDDPISTYLKLKIEGTIIEDKAIKPTALNFGVLNYDEKKTLIVELVKNYNLQLYKLIKITNENPNITICRLNSNGIPNTKIPIAGALGKFAVTVTAPQKPGIHRSTVIFNTDLETQPEQKLGIIFQCREIKND